MRVDVLESIMAVRTARGLHGMLVIEIAFEIFDDIQI